MPKCWFKSGLIFKHPSWLSQIIYVYTRPVKSFSSQCFCFQILDFCEVGLSSQLSHRSQNCPNEKRWLVDISSIDAIYCPTNFTVQYLLIIYVCLYGTQNKVYFFLPFVKVCSLHSQLLIPTNPAKVFHPLSCAGCQVNTLCDCALSGGGSGSSSKEGGARF